MLVISDIMAVAGMWPMLQDRPVMDAVRLRALWPGPAFAPIYVTWVCLGDRVQFVFSLSLFPFLVRWSTR